MLDEASNSSEQCHDQLHVNPALNRPKRAIIHKTTDNFTGLSWNEQNDLKKALYASLRADHVSYSNSQDGVVSATKGNDVQQWVSLSAVKSLNIPPPAQRKFASVDSINRHRNSLINKKVTRKKAKTEDFLSFLCMRGRQCDSAVPLHTQFLKATNSGEISEAECNNVRVYPADVITQSNTKDYLLVEGSVSYGSSALPSNIDETKDKIGNTRRDKRKLPKESICINSGHAFKPVTTRSAAEGHHLNVSLNIDSIVQYNKQLRKKLRTQNNSCLVDSRTPAVTCRRTANDSCKAVSDSDVCNVTSDSFAVSDATIPGSQSSVSNTVSTAMKSQRSYNTTLDQSSAPAVDNPPRMPSMDSQFGLKPHLQHSVSNCLSLVLAPTFHPSDELFQEPISYIELLHPTVVNYGLCRIVPPSGWNPDYNLSDSKQFTIRLQHIHRLLSSHIGPNDFQLACRKHHLETLENLPSPFPPTIDGVEVDLVALSDAVKQHGGLQTVASGRKWLAVSKLCYNATVHSSLDRISERLSEIYRRYVSSYDSLSESQRHAIERNVLLDTNRCQLAADVGSLKSGKRCRLIDFKNVADCVSKAQLRDISQPTTEQIENLFWKIVIEQTGHVEVQSGQLTQHSAFTTDLSSPYSVHGWNFNKLAQSEKCLLRQFVDDDLSEVLGPYIHVEMMFSTSCWQQALHCLPYIQYIHKGADVIWYCVPAREIEKFKSVVKRFQPEITDADFVSKLSSGCDAIMLTPKQLIDSGVELFRLVQSRQQYVTVEPGSITLTLCTGFSVSERIYVATPSWLHNGYTVALTMKSLQIPDLFSVSKLIYSIAVSVENGSCSRLMNTVGNLQPLLVELVENECRLQLTLIQLGVMTSGAGHDEYIRCDVCKTLCYLSVVINEDDDVVYCLEHAVEKLKRRSRRPPEDNIANYTLFYHFTPRELQNIVNNVERYVSSLSDGRKQ